MESYARYFPKGCCRPPSAEYVTEPRANEAIVFEDFFTAGLRMPPHPVLVDILHKFWVHLHHLTLMPLFRSTNLSGLLLLTEVGLLQMSSLDITSCATRTRRFILRDRRLPSPPNSIVSLFIPLVLEIRQSSPPL
jgi:hypothetical protein